MGPIRWTDGGPDGVGELTGPSAPGKSLCRIARVTTTAIPDGISRSRTKADSSLMSVP
ncbi:hypothetical protein ABH922_005715 [Rhodococcus sp. 27YEA15]